MVKLIDTPVEFMVMILMNGGWVVGEDWKPYVRFAITNRLINRKKAIFTDTFSRISDDFLNFQRNGGDFATQKRFRSIASRVIQNPLSVPLDIAVGRLILSTISDVEVNTLIQPFHWIRVAVSLTDISEPFGNALLNAEMKRQKITLTRMLNMP